ncbi:MAG: glucoamylase family protein [Acidobacteriota bacterium]
MPPAVPFLIDDDARSMLDELQHDTFRYFLHEADAGSGLVLDSTAPGSHASIAVVGLALSSYPVGVERGFLTRDEAAARTAATLRFFWNAPQGPEHDAAGHRGFFYHFLEMRTGRRAWECELSTMDSALFFAGALTAAAYFDGGAAVEREIRSLAEALYLRADWKWACDGGETVTHGWKPGSGFLRYRWGGYSEALLLYVLGLGSPTFPLARESYRAFTSTYSWKEIYGIGLLYAGPLFVHQFPHLWIDFRGIRDAFMRERRIDYFENSRRAAFVQQRYAVRNPKRFKGYGGHCWGITAGEGPGPATRRVGGVTRRFFDYRARGVPYGPDDGTLAPWAAVASLPFAPEIVVPTIRHLERVHADTKSAYGFLGSFNPTFPARAGRGWIAPRYLGLNEGPIVLMIENHRTGLLWRLTKRCGHLVAGLRRAGFREGWLG